VPYYQAKFSALGFEPGDLKSEQDFQSLPVLEKEDIRQHQDQLIANNADRSRMRPATTGGTTGEPLSIYSDPRVPLSPMTWRMLEWWGVDISDNSAYLYRAVPRGLRRLASDLFLFPTRRKYIQAAHMDEARIQQFINQIRRTKPKYLVGYVGAINALADYLKKHNIGLPFIQVVWTTAAPLPELKRIYFEKTFGCPVFTQYGSVEFFMIAAECPEKSGLHIWEDIRKVEILNGMKSAEVGESGDVVVSDLTNYSFPLLRYRLGDRGCLLSAKCACGRCLPLMDYVKGRISDQIRLPEGGSIPGEYWTTIFDDYPKAIKSFQVYQRKDYSVEIRYEAHDDRAIKAVQAVSKMLEKKIKGSFELKFIQAPVNTNENGKTRFVKSELS
jgi:phenylacetate-CoA ligase